MKNRPIEFRVWDKELKIMHQSSERFKIDSEGNVGLNKGFFKPNQDGCEYVLVQFTGVLDKNGVKIFEGDVYVMFTEIGYHEDTDEYEYKKEHHVVKYSEGVCSIGFQFLSHHSNIEVVGNIHQHPHLLKTEQ